MTMKEWAGTLSADRLDRYRSEKHEPGLDETVDRRHRAAMRELRIRGRCGATNNHGASCYRVPKHSDLHEGKTYPTGIVVWNYDARKNESQ
jgi:hypothetical protein